MRILILLLTLLSLQVSAAESNQYELFDNKLTIEVPKAAKKLTNKAMKKRYGSKKAPPQYAFSNRDKNASFTITQYGTPADKKSMEKIHMQLSAMLRKGNETAKWKKDKTNNKFGTKVAIFEYENSGVGKYQYNLTMALPIDGKLTMISFVTTKKKGKDRWVKLARESLNSIKIN